MVLCFLKKIIYLSKEINKLTFFKSIQLHVQYFTQENVAHTVSEQT